MRTPNWLIGPLLAVGALLLYTRTMAPSLGGTVDSAEFQQGAYSLAIVHPTGYPLYLLLARLWITLFPFGDPAFKVNLLSAVFGVLSVWVLYETVRFITRNRLAAAGAASLFAVQAIPWAQAGVAEINTMNNLLTGLAFLALVRWADGKAPLPLAMLAYGLAVSHHRTALLYAPLLLVYALLALRRGKHAPLSLQSVALGVMLMCLPFLAYLYPFVWAEERGVDTRYWGGFWGWAMGESALPVIQGTLNRPLAYRSWSLLGQVFWGWPGRALLGLGLAGLVYAGWQFFRVRKIAAAEGGGLVWRATLLYAAATLLGIAFATVYDILDVLDYLGVPIFMWCVVAGSGIAALLWAAERLVNRRYSSPTPRTAVQAVVLVGLAGLCVFTASRSLSRLDVRVDFSDLDRRTYWRQVQAVADDLPQGAILIGDWPEYNEALYYQRVEGWRPDLSVHVLDALLAAGMRPLDPWLAEQRPVYVLGTHYEVLSRYETEQTGPLWRVTGEKEVAAPPPIAHRLDRRYGDTIVLLGYTLEPDPATVPVGGLLTLTLYWQATERVSERYVVFNHVIDAQGGKVGQQDDEPNRGFTPTVYWTPGQQIVDRYAIEIQPGTPPGTYRLMTGLYTRLGERRLPAYTSQSEPLGDYPELTTITVR